MTKARVAEEDAPLITIYRPNVKSPGLLPIFEVE
jgi:hypothetical protein